MTCSKRVLFPSKRGRMPFDQQDLSSLYAQHYPKIAGYLRRLVGEAEAEDVAQETFLKAGKSLNGFRGESSLSTWIYRIATNAAMDHLRKPGNQNRELPDDGSESGDMIADADSPLLDTLLIRKDMNECIRGIVNSLPENYRSVLVLSEFEGFTNQQIADILDVSLETIKIRLHRARTRLRKELETHCSFYRDERNELSCDRKAVSLKFLSK